MTEDGSGDGDLDGGMTEDGSGEADLDVIDVEIEEVEEAGRAMSMVSASISHLSRTNVG